MRRSGSKKRIENAVRVPRKLKGFTEARDYAYRLLGYRARSCWEIRERMKRRGISEETAGEVVEHLKKLDYLNDEEFACAWVREILRSRPSGETMLKAELRKKGIDEQTADKAVSDALGVNPEEDLLNGVVEHLKKKYRGIERIKRKKRIYDSLRRRGFRHELIYDAIREL